MAKKGVDPVTDAEFSFPLNGIDQTRAYLRQRPLTSVSEQNMRSFDPFTGRARGGVRAGLIKACNAQINGSNPIQDLNALDTVTLPPIIPYDGFVYAEGTGSGFGLAANSTGVSTTSGLGAIANYAFANSCWDTNGNLYAAERDTAANAAGKLYCFGSGSFFGGPTWQVATPILPSAATSSVCGMCVIGQLLFVAYITTAPNTGSIYVYNTLTGATLNGPWVSALTFSSASHNVLASIGLTLGVATYTTATGFKTYLIPVFQSNNGTALVANQAALTTTKWVGTSGNEQVKVVGDGTSNFYMIAPVTASMLVKISIAGVISLQTNALDAGNGAGVAVALVYDNGGTLGAPQLLGVSTGTTKVMSINLATLQMLTAVTATASAWSEIDSDNQGNFTLWMNSQSSDDVMALNVSLTTKWGPSTLANAVHRGCSVSKAAPFSPASTATRQIRLLAVSGGLVQRINMNMAGSITQGSNVISYATVTGTPMVNMGVWGPGIPPGAYITATAAGSITISQNATQTCTSSAIMILGAIALAGGGGQTLHPSQVIFSAQNGLNMFYADGAGSFYYNAQADMMQAWTATTAGTMPTDGPNNTVARQIETWRGRTVLFGFASDPQVIYMSAISDPFNWLFSPVTPTATQAVAMDASLGGFGGDFVTGICPYDDDTLIVFCQHSIWQLSGDPAAGGQLDLVSGGGPGSNGIGAAWGRAWCKDPMGQIWFFGSQCGVWKMTPGALPIRQSQQIEKMIEKTDLSLNVVKMYYDLQNQAVQIFISPLTAGPTTNFCWEERVNAWHPDSFTSSTMQPLTTYINQSDNPDSRMIMLGCQDGYIRTASLGATNDDGEPIDWYVWLGPLMDPKLEELQLLSMQATLGANSGSVTWAIYAGKTAEDAFNGVAKETGGWSVGSYIAASGRNHVSYVRRNGIAIYLELSGTSTPATFERIMLRFRKLGKVRSRQ